jgi:hypothetical protein
MKKQLTFLGDFFCREARAASILSSRESMEDMAAEPSSQMLLTEGRWQGLRGSEKKGEEGSEEGAGEAGGYGGVALLREWKGWPQGPLPGLVNASLTRGGAPL